LDKTNIRRDIALAKCGNLT